MGAGITLLRPWASAGLQVKPSDAKIDLGWSVGEQPAVEWENERMNTRDDTVNEIITYLNTGVPIADVLITSGDSVTISDATRTNTHDISGFKAELDDTQVYQSDLSAGGISHHNTTTSSQVENQHTLAVDISGETWSQVAQVTVTGSSHYLHRMDGIMTIPISGTSGASTFVKSVTIYDSGGARYYHPYFESGESSGNMYFGDITILTDFSLGALNPSMMIVEVVTVVSTESPL